MESEAERALVEAAVRGDRDAFGALVLRYRSRIVNLARALTGEDGEADDLAQDAFVRAWRGMSRFRGEASFKTWLYQIAVNVIHSHLAARSRRRTWFGRSLDDESAATPEPVRHARFDEDVARRDAIDRALAALPEELRVAVTLRDVQGLEYGEIAAALKIPLGTVESRIFRARQRLRPLLAALLAGERHDV